MLSPMEDEIDLAVHGVVCSSCFRMKLTWLCMVWCGVLLLFQDEIDLAVHGVVCSSCFRMKLTWLCMVCAPPVSG